MVNVAIAAMSALARAASHAYRQALVNAERSGVASEHAAKMASTNVTSSWKRTMSLEEARAILGVSASASASEIATKYAKLYEANEKSGSFYLLSKVARAKEAIESEGQKIEGKGNEETSGG